MRSIISNAVKSFKTPFYLYEEDRIIKNLNKLKSSVFPQAQIFYSMKANPLIGILKVLINQGCGIEAASKGELMIAQMAGCNSHNIIFTSPGKTYNEIKYAIEQGIFCINIESLDEMSIINEIATKLNKTVNIGIRINPDFKNSARIQMVGSTQFGIETNQLEAVFETAAEFTNIHIIGIQVYMGTQILDAVSIINNTKNIIEMALSLAQKYNFKLNYLNMGGGFGIPYFPGEKDLDMYKLKHGLHELLFSFPAITRIERIIFESGRFIVAESGVFVTKVLYKKQCHKTKYLICDGGSNLHSSSAFLGRFVRNNFPMYSLTEHMEQEEVTITGPLCTPTDILGQNVQIAKCEAGDYIVIDKSGAYGLTQSPNMFLSHELPSEIMYSNNEYYYLRKPHGVDYWILGQDL